MALLILFAFLSGVATIVSPCVLPVLPLILSTSVSGGRARPLGIVLGFAASFVIATLAITSVLGALGLPQDGLRLFAIVALGLFGLSMLIPAWGRATERLLAPLTKRAGGATRYNGFGGGLVMGAGLGVLWSPCAGPIMASVIALAVTAGVTSAGIAITAAYALGAGLPMLAIGYGARRIATGAKGLAAHAGTIRRGFGALTVLTCLLLLFGLEGNVQNLLPTQLSTALTSFERSASVQQEIDNLANQPTAMPAVGAALQPTEAPIPPTEPPTKAAQAAPKENTATAVPATAVQEKTRPTTTPAPERPAIASTPAVPEAAQVNLQDPGIKLPDMGAAPELTGLQGWINSDPLTVKSLRGKVVIVDFWTFECYNCRNTLPYVQALYAKYHSRGLEILGIHTPEFAFERVPANVRNAAKEQGVVWPIGLDPDYKTWSAYNNRYWPAFYFIDAQGRIRYQHFGEGNYDYHDKVVQQLLYEAKTAAQR